MLAFFWVGVALVADGAVVKLLAEEESNDHMCGGFLVQRNN